MTTAQDLYRSIGQIMKAADALHPIELLPGERMALGGALFQEAPRFVHAVAEALADEPARFADIPLAPQALLDRQDRALAYLALARGLRELAQQATDHYLHDQAGVIADSMAAVRQVRLDAGRPFPAEDTGRRLLAMALPEQVLACRQARKLRVARKTARRAAAIGQGPLLPRPPARSPQAAAASAAARKARAAALEVHLAGLGLGLGNAAAPPGTPADTNFHTRCAQAIQTKIAPTNRRSSPGLCDPEDLHPSTRESLSGPRLPSFWEVVRRQ